MPLRDDLLTPIPGDNPSGVSLRYDRVYDQIKEARTQDDDSIPSGEWQRQIKKADYGLVIKLAGEAIAARSKDLQLLAWLTEAQVRREGFAALAPCLDMFLSMQRQFWPTLYPEFDEDDAGLRAVPVDWVMGRMATVLKELPLTRSNLNFHQYRESRAVGYEADAEGNDGKRAMRNMAIQDGKATAEDFDKALLTTPRDFYADLAQSLEASLESLRQLREFCEEKYGEDGPSIGRLQTSIEEVHQVVRVLLHEKRRAEPEVTAQVEEVAEPELITELPLPEPKRQQGMTAEVKQERQLSPEPSDPADALTRVHNTARYLHAQDPASPIPYLLHMAVRWGELRQQGSAPSLEFLVPPATEMRQKLKRLTAESSWSDLLVEGLNAVGAPCGRAWLDAQRYIWQASRELGRDAIAGAVVASLKSVLQDAPWMADWTLNDDTPAANAETQRWIETEVRPKPAALANPQPQAESLPDIQEELLDSKVESAPLETDAEQCGAWEQAQQLLQQGQAQQGVQILVRDADRQPSGRARFQARMRAAEYCLSAGYDKVAHPMLEQLAREIERRNLEEWEAGEMLARALSLLLKCPEPAGSGHLNRGEIFSHLCRLDPAAAVGQSSR